MGVSKSMVEVRRKRRVAGTPRFTICFGRPVAVFFDRIIISRLYFQTHICWDLRVTVNSDCRVPVFVDRQIVSRFFFQTQVITIYYAGTSKMVSFDRQIIYILPCSFTFIFWYSHAKKD